MSPNKHTKGMRGVHLAAAELCRLGYSVTLTARNSQGADLLLFDSSTGVVASIEVKTDSSNQSFWLVSDPTKTCRVPTHFFALVNVRPPSGDTPESIDYYLVPARILAEKTIVESNKSSTWFMFRKSSAKPFAGFGALEA